MVPERPGLKIVAPSTPADAKALLKAAIRDDNPVMFLEHKRLYSIKRSGPTPRGRRARRARGSCARARDVTLVSAMKGVHDCLAAADELHGLGIEAEVIDLRTLRPLDHDDGARVARQDQPPAVVEEGPLTGGWAGEVVALAAEHGARATSTTSGGSRPPTPPIPYSPPLEDAFLPGAAAIVASVAGRLGRRSRPRHSRASRVAPEQGRSRIDMYIQAV